MRIRLITRQTVLDFASQYPGSKIYFDRWLDTLKTANWKEPGDISNYFNTADLLGKGSNRVIFDVGGNNYRIICKYIFGRHMVHLFICWIGSHGDYDKLCRENKQYDINKY